MTGEAMIGTFVCVMASGFFVLNLVTAYRTEGGAIGQVPVMAPPVVLPVMALAGLALIDRAMGWPDWPVWAYVVCWIGLTAGAWQATAFAGTRGARRG